MLTVLRPRDSPNCTLPSTSANSVSSPPRPTFAPGWNFVPRWRIRISPALTAWPPKRLTPRRCALESRPLRELDAPFLCAISLLLSRGDVGDLELGQLLTVALPLVVTGLVLELVDADLRALGLRDHLGLDRNLGQLVGGVRDGLAVDEQDGRQRHLVAWGGVELLDLQQVPHGDLVLLTAGLDDGVHRGLPLLDQACRCAGTELWPTTRWAVLQATAPPKP